MEVIRPVIPEIDAPAITEICNHYILNTTVSFDLKPIEVESMAKRIKSIASDFPYFVCVDDRGVAGYCYVHPWKERPAYCQTLETTIYLAPERKGKGIGHRLMDRLIDDCRHRGYHVLIACITAENLISCRFHEKLGFKKVSDFPEVGFKFGRYLDVVDYALLL